MVTGTEAAADGLAATLRVDGSRPLSAALVAELGAACDGAEDGAPGTYMIIRASGGPGPEWASGLSMALVSKWERGLRRLERLPVVTAAVADGDCGGAALDVLLTADYRIMTATARLTLPVVAGATWPGMTLYRLARRAAGAAPARRAALFGTPVDAATAYEIGVIDEVSDDAATAFERATAVAAAGPGTELAIRRQLSAEALTTSFEDALGVHLAACDRALRRAAAEVA